MSLTVTWARSSVKDLRRLDTGTRQRVRAAVRRYAESGHGDVKRLQDMVEEYRLRVGDWRVRFTLDWASRTMTVQRVVHRSEAY